MSNYNRDKLTGWKPKEGTEDLYEEIWFYGKPFYYKKGTEKHKLAKIKYGKFQKTKSINYQSRGRSNARSGKVYFT